ncbi:MAG: hypothetical protein SFT81_00535 [Candidatus Caenarcaniphilales bacterium]|nr:hypothetical protein [Candidatus Caenarcaniphilales bacterium]
MNIIARHPILLSAIRWGIGTVFLVAGISKLFPFEAFVKQVLVYRLPFPDYLLYYGSIIVITLEVWVGLSIFFGINLRLALRIARILLISMIPITIWGTFQQAPSCGCYGQLLKRKPWVATVEDCVILAVSFLLAPEEEKTKDGFWVRGIEISFILIALASGVYALTQLNQILASQSEKLF